MFPDGLPEIPALTADEEGYLAALESALQNPADSFDPCLDLLPLPADSIPGSPRGGAVPPVYRHRAAGPSDGRHAPGDGGDAL